MDNVQDIIVFLFIAFSILSSLLKKKKKGEKGKQPARPAARRPAFNLEEMLGIQTPPEPKKKQQISEVDAYFLGMTEEKKPEPKVKSYADKRAEKIKELESLKQKDKLIKTTVEEIKSRPKSFEFKEKLLNASSLREYIVVNEILGKPLALRD
jgi:hypothetical protein